MKDIGKSIAMIAVWGACGTLCAFQPQLNGVILGAVFATYFIWAS